MDIETAFDEYQKPMERHVSSFCGDPEAAKDAVSHAFTQAWMKKTTLEAMPCAAMKAWLYAAARNKAIDIKRFERRFAPVCDEELADDEIRFADNRLTVKELFLALSTEQAIIVHMKYYQGMNSNEIGAALRVKPATVRTRLKAALSIMRKNLRGT